MVLERSRLSPHLLLFANLMKGDPWFDRQDCRETGEPLVDGAAATFRRLLDSGPVYEILGQLVSKNRLLSEIGLIWVGVD